MAFRRLLPRALVLVVSGLLAALPAGAGLVAVVPAQVVRADAPEYATWDGGLNGGSSNAAAPAGIVNLAVPAVAGEQPANPDPASVTATAGTAGIQGAAILQSDLSGSNLAATTVVSLHLENLPIQIPLSTIPLSRSTSPKSWQDLLSSTVLQGVPLQNVTWSQLTQLSPAPAGLGSITMADIDWSGSALANLPLDAFTFGGADITTIQIPLQPGEPAADMTAADRWCYRLNQAQAGSCPSAASLAGMSLLGVSIQGAALKDLPLHDIPLHDIDLSTSPLHDIPLHDIVLEVSSLTNIPLHDIDMVNSPLHDIPLHDIDLATSPLHDIPLHDIDWVASPLHDIPLHDINLATSPVGAIPLHDIAFADAPLHDIPLHDIDLAASGLATMPLSAIAWGTAPIGTTLLTQLTIAGGPLAGILLSATANPGHIDACVTTCPAGETLGDAETAGEILSSATLADIGGSAFGNVTLGQLLAGSALDPKLGDLRLDLAGAGAPPLTVAGLEGALSASAPPITLGDLRLDEATGVNALILGDLSDHLSDPATFDAYLLGDIGTYTDNTGHEITLGELGVWTNSTGAQITLGELAQYLDDSVSLGDVLLGLVPPAQFPFENFPITSLGLSTPGRSMIQPSSGFLAGYGSGCGTSGTPIGSGFITNLPTCFTMRLLGPENPDMQPSPPVLIDAVLPLGAQFLAVAPGGNTAALGAAQTSIDPDGRQRVVFEFPSIPAGSLESFELTYENSLHLGANDVDFEMRALDGTLISTASGGGPAVQDAAEPNSPIEDPTIEDSGRSDQIAFPINPAGCSGTSPSCTGAASTYIDAMVAGYISYPGDLDWYYLPNVRAGSRISADLTNLPLDADLVLYGPPGISTSPTLFPPSTSKLPGLLVEDPGLGVGQAAHSIATQALGDLQLDKGYINTLTGTPTPVPPMTPISISQHRGTDPESVGAIAPVTGDYVVAVTGYNGATSNDPYLLRARVTSPPAEASCPPRSFTNSYGSAGMIPSIAANVNTLFLTDPGRIVATYGQAAEDTLAGQLADLVSYLTANPQLGVVPAVIPLEAYPGVAGAYSAWDSNPCSVAGANAVAAQITGVIHSIRATAPGISYITIVGGDDIVPMGRVPDLTRVSNESEYASTFTATNPISAAEAASETLTDDVYGDPNPTPTGDGNNLFVPQMAVGRLVESPSDIGSQLESYVTNKGTLDTKTGLVAGYDFLADGAQAVADRLATGDGGRTIDTLIDQPGATPGWSQADLLSKLFPAGGASPIVDSLNAHYDHTALEPSAVNAGTSSQLESDSDLVASAAGQLAGHILFTMGCHAGLSVPDAYVPGTTSADAALKLDWAQALSQAGVSIYVANTGYGIGDTSSVAYSERLMGLYAEELNGSLTAGQALAYAKQAYYGSLGAVGVYDLKVLQQVAFYGLPFWYVGAAPTGNTPPPPPTAPAPMGTIGPDPSINGLQAMPLTVASTFTQKTVTGRGSFWVVNGPGGSTLDPQVTQYEPIQPATSQSVVTPNLTAHGALITALTSHDVQNVNPVLNTPTIDLSASSPEIKSGDAAWPASIAAITNSTAPYGRAQGLVVVPGQFLGSTSDGTGRQRLFDSVGLSVLYGSTSSTDFNPPTIATTSASAGGSSITFKVSAADGEGPVAQVLAGFHDFDGSWKFVNLTLQSDGSWSGIGNASHAFGPSDGIEYFIQAVDAAGNVSTASNKAANFDASTDTTPPIITATVSPAPNAAGWSDAASETVTFTCSDSGSGIVPGTCPTPQVISSEGQTTVTESVSDRAGNSASATAVVQIDQTAPMISATVSPPPNASGWSSAASETVTFTCSDAGSGLATACPVPVTVSTEGTTPVSASVTDVAGNTATASVSIKLDRTAPTISASVAPVPNANGWDNGTSAKVTFTCTDTGSGIASGACPAPITVSTEGVNPVTASVTDQAGNLATIAATVRLDHTAPTISAVVSPAPNASGWSNAASETVTFTCGDTGSGLAASACPAPQTVTATGATTVSGTVVDLAGNSTTKSVVVKIDQTPPTISAAISPAPNSAGWLNILVAKATVTFTCTDGGSGLASGACPTPVVVSTEGITSVTRSVTDLAGNTSSATATVRIDRTAPVVTLTGYPVHPVCTTTDALSGVKVAASLLTATGRVAGIPVTVATCLGAFDVAGNLALPVVRTYVAPITFSGFQAPVVNPPTVNTGSAGKAYPVKFQLRDAGGALISALPAVASTTVQSVSCTTFGTATSALPSGTNAATSLAYDSKANQYVYTWKTPSAAGCYVLTVGLADGTSYKANFKLK
ncbi:MAG TPA: PxKF domain-containing protein [Candidatus Limnocylindrales bacterium]|nr:PxKF domain-containing protein [Candidatus Limnocylindrales bacterium]